jgi:hypothetical protein
VLIAAGALRAVGSFVPATTAPAAAVQVLYLLTDICILFGLFMVRRNCADTVRLTTVAMSKTNHRGI